MSGSGRVDETLLEQARQYLLFCQEMGVADLNLTRPQSPDSVGGVATGVEPAAAARAEDGAEALLEDLRLNVIGDCRRCKLCEGRHKIVFGTGDPGARLLFVGEGPGADEDRQGIPFVGKAGQLLNKIIGAMGLARDQVYIANVVKCRPPDNRAPRPDETAACTPFLFRQIEIIAPRVIVALGAPAAHALIESSAGITKMRGTFREFKGIPVMPTFHPAYLLRNPAAKKEVWDDMQMVMALLAT